MVVVERYAAEQEHPITLALRARRPAEATAIEGILHAYRGFEGAIWPEAPAAITLQDGFAPRSQLALVRAHVDQQRIDRRVDLLYCRRTIGQAPSTDTLEGFKTLGVDVGIYFGKDNCYSAILHEVLWGKNPSLTAFMSRLNEHLLFENVAEASAFMTHRQDLAREGHDVESDEAGEFALIHVALSVNGREP